MFRYLFTAGVAACWLSAVVVPRRHPALVYMFGWGGAALVSVALWSVIVAAAMAVSS
jgi:hypothetical protein